MNLSHTLLLRSISCGSFTANNIKKQTSNFLYVSNHSKDEKQLLKVQKFASIL